MTNKQLAKQLRDIGNSLFDRTNDPNFKLLLDEASDRLENQSKWISVEERLPEKNGQYLCFRNGYISVRGFALNLKKIDDYDFHWADYSGWYDYDNEYGHFEVTRVTHWMPLPEAPKGGAE